MAELILPISVSYLESMLRATRGHGFWWGLLAAVVGVGILSRITHTGLRVFDKYLGDALYAVMIYVLLRLTGRIARVTLWAAIIMTAIEFFQLTGIPATMFRSGYLAMRVFARLLGTEFSLFDLLAYAVGIACVAAADRTQPHSITGPLQLRKL